MGLAPEENSNWQVRANLLIGLKVPYRYSYLITSELVAQGAELLRNGHSFEVQMDEQRLAGGFDAVTAEGVGDLPGVTSEGISASGLITLVPKTR